MNAHSTVSRRPGASNAEVAPAARWVDFSFAVTGVSVGQDYADALHEALRQLAPWLDDEPLAAVHPLRGLTPAAESLLLGGRARLVLRVPEARIETCEGLQGGILDLPLPLRIGRASRRELLSHPVLHSTQVITGAGDESDFVIDIDDAVAALGLDCTIIVGRRRELRIGGRLRSAFSLMLHGLSVEDSLKAQAQGLGLHRKLGCGIFVPHRSVAAVGL